MLSVFHSYFCKQAENLKVRSFVGIYDAVSFFLVKDRGASIVYRFVRGSFVKNLAGPHTQMDIWSEYSNERASGRVYRPLESTE
jgi:hypothetical protein